MMPESAAAPEPIGNATHANPISARECICCSTLIEGAGYEVQYATDAPPDVYCDRECFDMHEQELCLCFMEVEP